MKLNIHTDRQIIYSLETKTLFFLCFLSPPDSISGGHCREQKLSTMVKYSGEGRDPCPDRIISDAGAGFAMGAVGGSVLQFLVGAKGGMRGRRMTSGFERARMKGPKIAGGFAVWSALFSTFDCSLVYLRQKEDPLNSVLAGAGAGGALSLRSGPRAMAMSALIGGALLALIEGASMHLNRMGARIQQQQLQQQQQAMQEPAGVAPLPNPFSPPTPEPELISEIAAAKSSSGSSSSWYGGLFSWGKKKKDESILESFDTPSPPVFYDYK